MFSGTMAPIARKAAIAPAAIAIRGQLSPTPALQMLLCERLHVFSRPSSSRLRVAAQPMRSPGRP